MAIELTRNSLLINLGSRLRQDFVNALPPELDLALVQESYRELCNERPWHGLKRVGWLIFPGAGSGIGGFTITSRIVTVDTATKSYLDALPQLQATRMTIIAPDGRPYQIYRWYSAENKVVLDRPYFGDTVTDTAFTIIKAYCLAPYRAITEYDDSETAPADTYGVQEDHTFRHFLTIRRVGSNTGSNEDRLYYQPNSARCSLGYEPTDYPRTLHPLDVIGPDFPGVSTDGPLYPGMPRFQIYPAYNGSVTKIYECQYMTTGEELDEAYNSRAGVLPAPFTTDLLVKAALWCEANKGTRPELQKSNWLSIMNSYALRYQAQLDKAIHQDDELWSKDSNIDGASKNQIEGLRLPAVSSQRYLDGSYMVDPSTVYLG